MQPVAKVAEASATVEAERALAEASVAAAPPPEAPAAEAPAAEAPAAEAPAAEVPAAEVPAAEAPATQTDGDAKPEKPAKPPVDPAVLEERRRRAQEAWDRVVAAKESGEVLTGTVTAAVKGGLLVDVGSIRGFLPASQTRVEKGLAIEQMMKKKLPLKVIDVDTTRRRIVVSHKRATDDERRAKRRELIASLRIGEIREATVVRLADFGAFVDLGGVDALIPMRELAFERVDKASDVLSIGDTLQVEVVRIEDGGKKIAVSRKNALPDPLREHAATVKPGAVIEGKVVAKEPRLQVELAPGVIGTVRENDANPADYEIGESIEVAVRSIDRKTRRINLTTLHGAAAEAASPQAHAAGFAPLGVELLSRRR